MADYRIEGGALFVYSDGEDSPDGEGYWLGPLDMVSVIAGEATSGALRAVLADHKGGTVPPYKSWFPASMTPAPAPDWLDRRAQP